LHAAQIGRGSCSKLSEFCEEGGVLKITRNLSETKRRRRQSAVTIGAFDGIHIGHLKILGEVVLLARGLGIRGVVLTFEPHPISVIQPHEAPCLLTSTEEKIGLIKEAGIDEAVILRFNPKLAQQSAEWFVENVLLSRLGMTRLVIGYDFRFGRGREGDASYLESLGEESGFGVDIVPPVRYLSHPVSSTRVRTALLRGDVKAAGKMLGRPYSFTGVVTKGEGRGKTLAYPTANLEMTDPKKMLPSRGIYAARVQVGPGEFPGALYIGTKPTYGGRAESIEVHIMGIDRNLYGSRLKVSLVERMRDDIRFKNDAALRRAIDRDVSRAKKILST
jgi:riboflavin kinase/FMN adenylyltransferase